MERIPAIGHISRTQAVFLAATLAVALGLLLSTSAEAYTQKVSGRPGSVTAYKMWGHHYNPCMHNSPPITVCWRPYVNGYGPVVYRSPATRGHQAIYVSYTLQRWNGSSWVHDKQKVHRKNIYAGHSRVRMPKAVLLPNSTEGYYRVIIAIAWGTFNDKVIGTRGLWYTHSRDYACNTNRTCSVGPGWMYMS